MTDDGISGRPPDLRVDDLDKDTAFAKIVEALVETKPEKITVLTDLDPRMINGLSSLLTWENYINKHLPKEQHTTLMTEFTNIFTQFRISKQRKSREEIIDALKTEKENQENKNALKLPTGIDI